MQTPPSTHLASSTTGAVAASRRPPGLFARIFGLRAPEPEPAWTVEGGVLRVERAFAADAPLEFREQSTRIVLGPGAALARGVRIALRGGEVRVGAGATIGEGALVSAADAVAIGEGAVVEDLCMLEAERAPLSIGARARVGRFSRLWAHDGPIGCGDGVSIGPSNAWIGTGRGISIAAGCDFTHAVTLDSAGGSIALAGGSGVGPNSVLYGHGGLRIGSGVAIAGLVMIVPGNHRFDRLDVPIRAQGVEGIPIEIGDDVWIGGGAVILGGARIGTGAVVGAGAVVRGAVADRAVVAGVPARAIATRGGDG